MHEKLSLHDMEKLWENDLKQRYPEDGTKQKQSFRNYQSPSSDTVKEFYRLNHINQTYDFVLDKEKEFLSLDRKGMSLWESVEYLNTLVDDSDPDTDLDQTQHLLQTSEAIRKDGNPDWFVLTGFLHDLGKVLCLFGEPQWAVVGDTYPVGCKYSDKIVYSEFFQNNPDFTNNRFNSTYGIYSPNCGLRDVHMSWGHDEYLYHVMKDYLPEEGLYILRYHSFYAQHKEDAYTHLMDDHDLQMFEWVKKFNQYDLYSKADEPPNVAELRPFYKALAAKYLPKKLQF